MTRPFAVATSYVVFASLGWYWVLPLVVFFLFVTVVQSAHDIVHRSLGFTERERNIWLFLIGVLMLESGHAYELTHARHHAVFPGPDDPEGEPARMSFFGALLHGPSFLPRMWLWAWRKSEGSPSQRRWLLTEACISIMIALLAIGLVPYSILPLSYVVMVIVGSWIYPIATVYLPHKDYGETPLTQTHSLRGAILPHLFLELSYHLEHHLYPQVPSHNLPILSQRLQPLFDREGVKPRKMF